MARDLFSFFSLKRAPAPPFTRTSFTFTAPRLSRSTRAWGNVGEEIARRYLARLHVSVLERNVHKRFGEIDLVGRDGPFTVFFEVKMRTSDVFGSPEDALTPRKLRHVIKAATAYCVQMKIDIDSIRIDLLAISFDPKHSRGEIRHYRGVSLS